MIDIQEYFDKKEQVTQAQESLQKTIQMLVSGFEDNFYFKLNKRATVTSDTLACNVTASFFIPCINEELEKKKVIEITMIGNLDFNKPHALQLTDFSGFSVNSKKRELTSDRLLLMMYPEIKVTDLPAFEDSTYVIFKGLVKMEKQSFLFQSFEDFCRSMTHFINPVFKDVSVHNDLKKETRYKIETNILFNFYVPHLEQAHDMKSFLKVSMNFCLVNYPEDKLPITTFKVSTLKLKSEQFFLKNALIQLYSDVVPKENPFFLNVSHLDKMHLNDINLQGFILAMNDKHIKPYLPSLFIDGKLIIEEYKTLINPRQQAMFTKAYNTLLSQLVTGISDEKIDFRDATPELKNDFFQLAKARKTLALFNKLNSSLDDKHNTSKKKI